MVRMCYLELVFTMNLKGFQNYLSGLQPARKSWSFCMFAKSVLVFFCLVSFLFCVFSISSFFFFVSSFSMFFVSYIVFPRFFLLYLFAFNLVCFACFRYVRICVVCLFYCMCVFVFCSVLASLLSVVFSRIFRCFSCIMCMFLFSSRPRFPC
jgi:hypothetical protein